VKILLTGADGQVGWELQRSLALLGEVHATNRATLDLSDAGCIRRLMRELQPALVVNAAAYTAVDKAEIEEALAFAINVEAPAVLAAEAARLGAGLVHYSTDYVFDGSKQSAYVEDDPTNPLGVYGRSKLAGEQAVAAVGGRSLVLRTTWVYADRGRNFPLTMLRLARERSHLRVVADQWGAPTPARLLAELTAMVVGQLTAKPDNAWPQGEIFHASCAGQTNWHGFASKVINDDALRLTSNPPTIEAITTVEYPTPALRPANSVLDTRKLRARFGLRIPPWEEALQLYFRANESSGLEGMAGGLGQSINGTSR
jgi:dTDP-4-dehydrorhamnose reductase